MSAYSPKRTLAFVAGIRIWLPCLCQPFGFVDLGNGHQFRQSISLGSSLAVTLGCSKAVPHIREDTVDLDGEGLIIPPPSNGTSPFVEITKDELGAAFCPL